MVSKVLLATTLISFISLPFVVAFTINEDTYSNFFYVGSVGDKSYFADTEAGLTWHEAKAHCNAAGMHLATVKTIEQNNFLNQAYGPNNFTGGRYWTAAKDNPFSVEKFFWDGTTEALNATVVRLYRPPELYTCLYFISTMGGNSRYQPADCNTRNNVLCEIIHGSN